MAYSKQTWANSGASGGLNATSEVNAERLSHMEDGIEAASVVAFARVVYNAGWPARPAATHVDYFGGSAGDPPTDQQAGDSWTIPA